MMWFWISFFTVWLFGGLGFAILAGNVMRFGLGDPDANNAISSTDSPLLGEPAERVINVS
jgi:hypothetical protein